MNIVNKILAWTKSNPVLAIGSIAALWYIMHLWKQDRATPQNAVAPDPAVSNPNP
jgi:hypothetical protein